MLDEHCRPRQRQCLAPRIMSCRSGRSPASYILTGVRLAMGNSFVTIIAAELVAANAGLGKMMGDARLYMLVDQIFVALLVLGLLGFTADRLFRWGIYVFAGRFSPVT